MDFARKQLEKYGWSEGKGLGKSEDGIVQALKPKPKHGSGGIGHDIAQEFTNHWWQKLYNTAAENIEIKTKENGEVDSILTKNDGILEINTQKFIKQKKKKETSKTKALYTESFTKRATLTNGTLEENILANDSTSSDDESIDKNNLATQRLTDDQLFAACGGRTAHKGARHGLQSNGKLARMKQQEEHILNTLKAKNKPLSSTYKKNDSSNSIDNGESFTSIIKDANPNFQKGRNSEKNTESKELLKGECKKRKHNSVTLYDDNTSNKILIPSERTSKKSDKRRRKQK